ncbi:hypothetical protein [Streptomyces puniciscabiei]|uniref:hypothetical protein n=1 Tax=Streptomyces puniciscabiei TaxID=164348 RepID=UPI0037A4EC83
MPSSRGPNPCRSSTAAALWGCRHSSSGCASRCRGAARCWGPPPDTARTGAALGESGTIALAFAITLDGALCLALAPKSGAAWFFAAAQALFGFSGPLMNISLVTLRQKMTPRKMLGRVNASARVLIMSSLPAGSLVFGALADAIGARSTLLAVSAGPAVVCALTARPLLRRSPDRAVGAQE